MARVVGIGHQNFEQLIQAGCFYIDKTGFIKEWWENQDVVTLIIRPRRFGKTLNMSMLEPKAPGAGEKRTAQDGGGFRKYCRDAVIIEFKVNNPKREPTLEDTVQSALGQIEEMHCEAALLAKGIPGERIRKYGFAFRGKEVLIG